MRDYYATRNVGDLVRVGGSYFGSIARVTEFHGNAEPTLITFEIVTPAPGERHIRTGMVDKAIAGNCPVVSE